MLGSLLTFTFCSAETITASCPEYDRSIYQHWIDDDKDCQDTRNEVLIAESLLPVTFKTSRRCKVKKGKWIDPYTGNALTRPQSLNIDHVIPLAEAHRSGAWKWNLGKKRRFANFLKNNGHLIAVSSGANRKKSDKDPARWLPSEVSFRKEYARIWSNAKVDWGLTANKAELKALKELLKEEIGFVYPKEAEEVACIGSASRKSSKKVPLGLTAIVIVKKSRNGICHNSSSRSYERTKYYSAFNSLEACLASGGRLPRL